MQTSLTEAEIQGLVPPQLTAYQPEPVDGTLGVSLPLLQWKAGTTAVLHNVYLGTSPELTEADLVGARLAMPMYYHTPGLQPGMTYYWRVDETVAVGPARPGPVWSFTTFLMIEDFEAYTDDEGSRIYETWVDGWTNNTGSTVGYIQAPFAERTIVRGGRQSMPLDYSNVKAPFYSEAEREFAPVRDFTVNGVGMLVLNVRGKAANGPAKLYLGLEDSSRQTAQVMCPHPAAVTTAAWTEWEIPLGDFIGVNVARIRRIYLRVGDKGDSVPGGFGQLYIDDIRVIKTPPVAK
ncbi:MAG: hypothetical protein FJ280_01470 [Planctomycetes bacterium]|nr:hypothetical protein [Planctomycetota bacterium]